MLGPSECVLLRGVRAKRRKEVIFFEGSSGAGVVMRMVVEVSSSSSTWCRHWSMWVAFVTAPVGELPLVGIVRWG